MVLRYFGIHMDHIENIIDTLKYAKKIGANCLQIYLGDKTLTTLRLKINLTPKQKKEIRQFLKDNQMQLVVHGILRFNFCYDPFQKRYEWGLINLAYDLKLANEIGAIGVIIHMGYYKTHSINISYEECEKNFVNSLIEVLKRTKKGNIILETNCNQTNSVGNNLEHFIQLYQKIPKEYQKRVKICIDTAHIFLAGYNIRKEDILNSYFKKIDEGIGLKNLVVIHLNDAKNQLGSHIDRHSPLKEGYIFNKSKNGNPEILNKLLKITNKYNPLMILETDQSTMIREIKLLRKLEIEFKGGSIKNNSKLIDHKKRILEIFEEMLKFHKSLGKEGNISTKYRISSYEKAIISLKKMKQPIYSVENVKKIPYIGKGFQEKIDEIIKTGTLKSYEELKINNVKQKEFELFKIWGIGAETIKELKKKNIHSINDLRIAVKDKKIDLTNSQKLGLEYYEELNKRISRKEIENITINLNKLLKKYPIKIHNAGSYRLGKKDSGDIDIIITSKEMNSELITNILKTLEKENIIIHYLSKGEKKIIAIVKFSNNAIHQMDISFINNNQLPWYFLYFGSDKNFSKKIRAYASSKGYKLNEKGLYNKKTGEKINFTPKNEKEIFEYLGIKYIEPINRNVTIDFEEI